MKRTRQQALETRNQILDAAEWVFVERGVAHTSLEDVAVRAGFTFDYPDIFGALAKILLK